MKIHTSCRVCNDMLETIMSLGEQYVSNFLLPGEPDGYKEHLELMLCTNCFLLQLKHTVPPETMFNKYWYRSGTNKTMINALSDIANKAEDLIHLCEGETVLDIGCNDGTLLAAYETRGLYRIGIDPAENLAAISSKIADKLIIGFFEAELFENYQELKGHHPKIITSIAMFYDLEDPNKFVSGIKKIMHQEGIWIVQMSYLPLMLKMNELGNICHEHIEYYSLYSFEYLLNKHGFEIVDLELNDINGGSLRAYIRNKTANKQLFADASYQVAAEKRIKSFRNNEIEMGLDKIQTYQEFALRTDRIKNDVVGFIKSKVSEGKKIYIYGASTKGNTVLQYYGLDNSLITAASDRNPDKWGRQTVGTHIPIVSEEKARADKPDYFLILPWHFLEEFKEREKDYLLAGGRFIVPAPYFTLI